MPTTDEVSIMLKCVRIVSLCATALSFVILPSAVRSAAADPIAPVTVTSGTVTAFLNATHTDLDIAGTDGFTIHTTVDSFSGLCGPCAVGDSQSLSQSIGGSMDGIGTFQGQTYEFNMNSGGGRFEFETPAITFPETADSTASFTVPFTLIGTEPFGSFVLFQPAAGQLFAVNVHGSGMATLFAEVGHFPGVGTLYSPTRLEFDFATPTPEPAPFILVSTMLGLHWWRRRHRVLAGRS
jgi:hypothetical protein